MDKLRNNYVTAREKNGYGNGRYVRKMLEKAQMNLAVRVMNLDSKEITTNLLSTIEAVDISAIAPDTEDKKIKIGFAH